MSTAVTNTQLYANYDNAVAAFVHGLTYPPCDRDEARRVLLVYASPERAFAQAWRRLKKVLGDVEVDAMKNVLPLPIISLERVGATYDQTRDSRVSVRRIAVSEDRLSYQNMRWPIPMTLNYQFTIWARQLRDLDDLQTQFLLLLDLPGPMTYIEVRHPSPMDERIVPVILSEVRNLPSIESTDKQRSLRRSITFQVPGWVIRPPTTVGIVETVVTEIHESADLETSDELLDTIVTIEGLD